MGHRTDGKTREERHLTSHLTSLVASGDPLHAYTILCTIDLDEARSGVSRVFSSHELGIAGTGQQLNTRMHHAPLGMVSINRLSYGATVDIDAGRISDYFLIMMPLAGASEIHCGNDSICSTPKLASVVSPTLPLRMRSSRDCDQIMVRIDRAVVERQCMQYLGHDLRRPIEFDLGMDLTESGSESWCGLVRYLVAEFDRPASVLASPLMRAHVVQLVVSTLLLAHPNVYREELTRPARPIAPAYVRRVEEFIEANADQPLTIAELAAFAGVSASALFAGFREYRDTSPIAFLKGVRMRRARDELRMASVGEVKVTDVAMRWGFTHLGRFATEYKRWFGESPSDTLGR